jgi:hypothetical protein
MADRPQRLKRPNQRYLADQEDPAAGAGGTSNTSHAEQELDSAQQRSDPTPSTEKPVKKRGRPRKSVTPAAAAAVDQPAAAAAAGQQDQGDRHLPKDR